MGGGKDLEMRWIRKRVECDKGGFKKKKKKKGKGEGPCVLYLLGLRAFIWYIA
jgi:hypothetical protein